VRRLLLPAALVALLVSAGAAPALCAPYAAGKYKGTTAQLSPDTQAPLTISFTVKRKTIVKVKFVILEQCDNGAQLLVTESFNGPVKIKKNRKFAYLVTYTNGSRALIKGKLTRRKASGIVSADHDHNQAGANCAHAGAVKFTARH
jgi:hypothetical protein